jgi:hypothetical protein
MQENTPMRTILICLAIIGMSVHCTKESDDGEEPVFEGEWFKTHTLVSPGPIGKWEKYKGAYAYLILMDSGIVQYKGAPTIDDHYNRYKVDGQHIIFYKEASTDSLRTGYEFKDNALIIWLPCIEPCGIKLNRVKYIL